MNQFIANIDKETGIAYGVISGRNCPNLMEEIMDNGHDLNYAAFLKELKSDVEAALKVDGPDISAVFGEHFDRQTAKEKYERFLVLKIETVEEFMDEFEQEFTEYYECEEPEYEYDSGDCQYLLSSLGGAAIIFVTKSPLLTYTRQCSPCIPNAGDLDTCVSADESNCLCYAVPVDYFDEYDPCPYKETGDTAEYLRGV